jgi:hypothetical protein
VKPLDRNAVTQQAEIATATFDTNVFPADDLVACAERVGIAVAVITVSRREVEGSTLEEEVAALQSVIETGVFGESRFGQALYASKADDCLERALEILSNRGFPKRGKRDALTAGQLRQLRDAMILCAHVRDKRDILVSNDNRAFIDHGRREAIEATFATRVMNVEEFKEHLAKLEAA